MDFEDTQGARLKMALATIRTDIDAAFDELLPVPDDTRAPLVEAMRHAAIGGGKRVRPLLLVATATMLNVSREAAILAGAAVESIHVYSLIHDDLPCMDDDDLRRGQEVMLNEALNVVAALEFEQVGEVVMFKELLADGGSFPDRLHLQALALRRQGDQETDTLAWVTWARRQTDAWVSATDPGGWDTGRVLREVLADARA